jgi:hypothetical protein
MHREGGERKSGRDERQRPFSTDVGAKGLLLYDEVKLS